MRRGVRIFGMAAPAAVLCVLVGVALGTGSYAVYYGQGLSYLSPDPKACVNCHIMRDHYEGWQKASHHAVATCNDCHIPHDLLGKYLVKAENGFWHSYKFTMQNFGEPIRIRPHNSTVLRANCVHCHETLVADIAGHGEGGTSDCVRCHASVGHGPTR
jgi:cytochrome c nitrite reductase small subunit